MKVAALLRTRLNTLAIAAILVSGSQSSLAADPSHLEHPHSAGTFMFEAMFMRMNMKGLRAGTNDVSIADATSITDGGYMLVPTKMTMDMLMLMPMYNFSKETSVMLMLNYLNNKMPMDGLCQSTMSTSGWADTQVSLSHKFTDEQFAVSMELNIPTGSINGKTKMQMLMGAECMTHTMHAPYGMQLGSGTYDLAPSITYLGAYFDWRYGAQISYKYRIGENDNNYSLGDEANATMWLRKPAFGATFSGELNFIRRGTINGEDEKMNTASVTRSGDGGLPVSMLPSPTNFASNSGGTLAELSLSVSLPVSFAYFTGEVAIPLYQDLNGIQMKRRTGMSLSIGAMF